MRGDCAYRGTAPVRNAHHAARTAAETPAAREAHPGGSTRTRPGQHARASCSRARDKCQLQEELRRQRADDYDTELEPQRRIQWPMFPVRGCTSGSRNSTHGPRCDCARAQRARGPGEALAPVGLPR